MCVCVSVCYHLSGNCFHLLTQTNVSSRFLGFLLTDFAKKVSFKRYGIICLPWLGSCLLQGCGSLSWNCSFNGMDTRSEERGQDPPTMAPSSASRMSILNKILTDPTRSPQTMPLKLHSLNNNKIHTICHQSHSTTPCTQWPNSTRWAEQHLHAFIHLL